MSVIKSVGSHHAFPPFGLAVPLRWGTDKCKKGKKVKREMRKEGRPCVRVAVQAAQCRSVVSSAATHRVARASWKQMQ